MVKLLLARAVESDGKLVAEHLTHSEIGHRVGATREMVGRVLRDLARGGYIETARGRSPFFASRQGVGSDSVRQSLRRSGERHSRSHPPGKLFPSLATAAGLRICSTGQRSRARCQSFASPARRIGQARARELRGGISDEHIAAKTFRHVGLAIAASASAQDGPVRILVGFPPGGESDSSPGSSSIE